LSKMGALFEWAASAIAEKAMAQSELDGDVVSPLTLVEPDPTESMPHDIRGYHRRTKHAPTRYALGPAFLDWTSQPCPFRRFDGARRIDLPLLDAEPTPPFPGPAPAPASLDCAALGLFFELAFGLSAWKSFEGSTWALRNNPSSGNLHPTEAYAVIDALDGLGATAGLYHYAPEAHALEERACFAETQILPPGGFLLALTSIPWRESWKYGERAYRYCQLDAGHAIGAAAQAGSALGWNANVLATPSDEEIARLVGLDRADSAHRREGEHPDLLIWIACDGGERLETLDRVLAAPREWHGAANRLSEDHDAWPVIDFALRQCVKGVTSKPAERLNFRTEAMFASPPIGNVVRRRRSAQRMDGVASLPREIFRDMLLATLPGAEPLVAASPWPPGIALLLFVHRVEGVEPGLYLFERGEELGNRLRASASLDADSSPLDLGGALLYRLRAGTVEKEATRMSCLQPIAGKGCFAAAMIADFDRTLASEGGFAYRRLHWEAGLIGQALYLWATAAGFEATGIGCFFDDEVHALLGLPRDQYDFQDIYHFTVGRAVEDPRLLTLPAYSDERRRKRL
jgi:SagB-type dehydrogenase family enzyme